MKYLVFETEVEAEAAQATIFTTMQPLVETCNGVPLTPPPPPVTQRWAIPQQILDGRWVIPSPDDEGVEYDAAWFPGVELN